MIEDSPHFTKLFSYSFCRSVLNGSMETVTVDVGPHDVYFVDEQLFCGFVSVKSIDCDVSELSRVGNTISCYRLLEKEYVRQTHFNCVECINKEWCFNFREST